MEMDVNGAMELLNCTFVSRVAVGECADGGRVYSLVDENRQNGVRFNAVVCAFL